jgi:hypothetical protein
MKASLWMAPAGLHTLRFDELDLDGFARLMRAVSYRQKVQVCDHRRHILGTWQAGELRDPAAELAWLTHRTFDNADVTLTERRSEQERPALHEPVFFAACQQPGGVNLLCSGRRCAPRRGRRLLLLLAAAAFHNQPGSDNWRRRLLTSNPPRSFG